MFHTLRIYCCDEETARDWCLPKAKRILDPGESACIDPDDAAFLLIRIEPRLGRSQCPMVELQERLLDVRGRPWCPSMKDIEVLKKGD